MAKNIYNKGKYKPERHNHLRPFLKRVCNKRWRKDVALDIQNADEDCLAVEGKPSPFRKPKKIIKVRFTIEELGSKYKSSYSRYYSSMREVTQALKRNAISRAIIFERKGQIIGQYERDDTKQVAANRKR